MSRKTRQDMELPRCPPATVPDIHPVPEYRAGSQLRARYEEMKQVFQVPWMGVVTMAYAHYPTFYDTLWESVRKLCASSAYVMASRQLRSFVEKAVVDLAPPPVEARLASAGYAPREIDDIRAVLEIFSHGNFPYLVLATIVRDLLEGGEMSTERKASKSVNRHAPDVDVPFVLMEPHHADAPTRAIYEDIKATLKLPFVNTDYRALARWPSYFAMAWSDLEHVVGTAPYEALVQEIHGRTVAAARGLPNPGRLTGAALRAAAARDASLEEVLEVSRLFQWLLPGLVANVAYFRHQLRR